MAVSPLRASPPLCLALLAAVGLVIRARVRRMRCARSVAWLQSSLRLRDNQGVAPVSTSSSSNRSCELRCAFLGCAVVIRLAADAGPAGMVVVFVCEPGAPATAAAAFGQAAAIALDQKLSSRGSKLTVLREGVVNAAAAVARVAIEVGAETVVIDAGGPTGSTDASSVANVLKMHGSQAQVVVVSEDTLLLPWWVSMKALGRRHAGGRILRWPAFLRRAALSEAPPPQPAPDQLPPSLSLQLMEESLIRQPCGDGLWAGNLSRMMRSWGEVSEAKAMQLARRAAGRELGNESASLGEASEEPSHLSPFLRWGVISARDCSACGMRPRNLLWREWSLLSWRLCEPLRHGSPVIAVLDGCCQRTRIDKNCETNMERLLPIAEWSEDRAFEAWCVGRTGAAVVDAGMRQLWTTGWMPRSVRLLAAACLVEGLGVDWRR